MMAPERLGELGGLAVADAPCDLPHRQRSARQQLGGCVHPDPRQMRAERRMPDLRLGPLQLAPRGRDTARDLVQRELTLVLLGHDRGGLLEEARA